MSKTTHSTLIPGPDGWWLAPEGAVVHCGEQTAVIADVHLGYEWSRGHGGDVVPAHSLRETIQALSSLLNRVSITRLVVAGDLVESPRPCRRTASDLIGLEQWLSDRGVDLIPVLGNHDSQREPRPPLSIEIDGWTISHGHRPTVAPKTIAGHDHPILRVGRTTARCLLVGPSTMILPAFTNNAAGLNVVQIPVPDRWMGRGLRCWAGTGSRLLDFGTLDDLPERLPQT